MGFQYKLKPSQEGTAGDLIGIAICTIIMIIFGWWAKRDEEKKKQGLSSSESQFLSFGKHVKRAHVETLFNEISRLPNEEVDKILDSVMISASPQVLQENIRLHQALIAEYRKFNQSRFSVLKAPIDDILNYTGSAQSILLKLESRYNDDPIDDEYCKWNCIPKEFERSMITVNESRESKSLREYGWSKSNLKVLCQHIVYFAYTVQPLEDLVSKNTKKFEDECMSLLKKNIHKLDWVDDPDNPDEMEQHVNDDDGPIAYLLGQQDEWLRWAFFDSHFEYGVTGSKFGLTTSLYAMLKICKILKKDLSVD